MNGQNNELRKRERKDREDTKKGDFYRRRRTFSRFAFLLYFVGVLSACDLENGTGNGIGSLKGQISVFNVTSDINDCRLQEGGDGNSCCRSRHRGFGAQREGFARGDVCHASDDCGNLATSDGCARGEGAIRIATGQNSCVIEKEDRIGITAAKCNVGKGSNIVNRL